MFDFHTQLSISILISGSGIDAALINCFDMSPNEKYTRGPCFNNIRKYNIRMPFGNRCSLCRHKNAVIIADLLKIGHNWFLPTLIMWSRAVISARRRCAAGGILTGDNKRRKLMTKCYVKLSRKGLSDCECVNSEGMPRCPKVQNLQDCFSWSEMSSWRTPINDFFCGVGGCSVS